MLKLRLTLNLGPPSGIKAELQQDWFRVTNILVDQRSVRTLTKVGGLVGKVMEVDERARFRFDYVRLKIAFAEMFLRYQSMLKVL